MAREPDWSLYRTFLAVLQTGSLSSAARSLGSTQPTVGRQIETLEAALGRPLFIRSPRGLVPTDTALSLRPEAQAMALAAAALLRAASGSSEEVSGTVRISASEVVGVEVLPPILTGLRERYPALVIELTLSNALDDLLRHETDIAVRMVEPSQDALVARRVGTIRLGFHAHRRYLDRRGTPQAVEDLQAHDLIGFDRETPFIRGMLARLGGLSAASFALRSDSDLAQLAAIRAGFGIGACQVPLARRDPSLVPVLPHAFDLILPAWVVMHEDLRSCPRCRATFDGLVEGLSRYIAETD